MLKHLSLGLLFTLSLFISSCAEIINVTTSKPIAMNANERTMGAKVNDQEIETVARVNIKKTDPQLEHAHINIDSFNGLVLLTGQVPSEELSNVVANTVYKLSPVREVHNELVVRNATDFADRSVDTWITTKIKSQLLADNKTESGRIRVVTEMKTVYLMGIVTHEEADHIADLVSHTRNVQKVVKVFEYLD